MDHIGTMLEDVKVDVSEEPGGEAKVSLCKSEYDILSDIAGKLGNILLLLEFEGSEYMKTIKLESIPYSDVGYFNGTIVYFTEYEDGSHRLVMNREADVPQRGESAISKGWTPRLQHTYDGYFGVMDPSPTLITALRFGGGKRFDEFIEFIAARKGKMVTNEQAIQFLQS